MDSDGCSSWFWGIIIVGALLWWAFSPKEPSIDERVTSAQDLAADAEYEIGALETRVEELEYKVDQLIYLLSN